MQISIGSVDGMVGDKILVVRDWIVYRKKIIVIGILFYINGLYF